jgi:hypothetical protein
MLRGLEWYKLTDVAEVLAAFIIALMMKAVRISETSVRSTKLHGAITQNDIIFILVPGKPETSLL